MDGGRGKSASRTGKRKRSDGEDSNFMKRSRGKELALPSLAAVTKIGSVLWLFVLPAGRRGSAKEATGNAAPVAGQPKIRQRCKRDEEIRSIWRHFLRLTSEGRQKLNDECTLQRLVMRQRCTTVWLGSTEVRGW